MTLLLILAGSRLKLKTKMTTSHLCLIGCNSTLTTSYPC